MQPVTATTAAGLCAWARTLCRHKVGLTMIRQIAAVICIVSALAAVAGTAAAQGFQTTDGGVKYKDLQVGSGAEAAFGQVALIHFAGWLDDAGAKGRELYNSRSHGRPVSFLIGTDGVMEGWNEGVVGMRPGGRRLLMIPSDLAYGNREVGGTIPANANVIFIFELLSLEDGS
jgi:FKBP-type peptidyl-prolyl cis-trans isomerase FkpA